MTDNVPVSGTEGPAEHGTAPGANGVSGATAQKFDPVSLGPAFARTRHELER